VLKSQRPMPAPRRCLTLLLATMISLPAALASVRPHPKTASRGLVRIGRTGQPGNIVYLEADVAKALHYFEDENLEVRFPIYGSGPLAAQALSEGKVDFSCNSIDYAIRTRDTMRRLKMVASFTNLPAVSLVVRRNLRSHVRSVQDLRGKRVGVSALGSGTHAIAASIFKSAGISLDAITFVAVGGGPNDMAAAFKRGEVDAAVSADPDAIRLLVDGDTYLLLDTVTYEETQRVFIGGYQFSGLLARVDVISRRHELVQRVVNALIRASRFIDMHSAADIAAVLPASVVKDRYIFVKSLEHTRSAFAAGGLVTADAVENTIQSQKALGIVAIGAQLNPTDFFDMSFVTEATRRKPEHPLGYR